VVNLRPSTRLRDGGYLRRYVRPRFAEVPLDAIGQREVRAWVAWLLAQQDAPATVVKAYQLLSKVMTAAVDAGMLAQSPCRNVPLPRAEPEEMRYLNPAEVATLAGRIHPRYRALGFVGAYGGRRIGELAALRRSRVELDAGVVDVAETTNELKGQARVRAAEDQGEPAQGQPAGRRGGRAGRAAAAPGPPDGLRAPGARRPGAAGLQLPP
jgi:integrase